MKRLLLLLVCLVPLVATARDILQEEPDYYSNSRRSDLSVLLLYHENNQYCREIQEEFFKIQFPTGYNEIEVNPSCFSVPASTRVGKKFVDDILAANKVVEQLVSENTFVMVCDMTGNGNGGFSVSMNAYLYQLANDGRKQKLEYIGKCSVNTGTTVFHGDTEMHKVILDACNSVLRDGITKLTRKYEIFRPLTTFQTYGGQGMYSYIGTKEGVAPRKSYEIVETFTNEFKQLDFKRLSVLKPVDIWDNNQFDPSLDDLEGERGTQFKTVSGKSLGELSESEQLIREKSRNSHIPNYMLTLNYNTAGGYGVMLGWCGPVGYYFSLMGNLGITAADKKAYNSYSIISSGGQESYYFPTPEVSGSSAGPVRKVKSGLYASYSIGAMVRLVKNSLFSYAGINYSEIDTFYSDGNDMNYMYTFCSDNVGIDAGFMLRCKNIAVNVGVVATPGCEIYPYRMNIGVGFAFGGKRR